MPPAISAGINVRLAVTFSLHIRCASRVPAGPLAGLTLGVVVLTVVVGLANSREVIRRTPLEILRQE